MIKILELLKIIQTVSNEERHKYGLKRLGRGYFEAHRFNPYNPLSYITLFVIFIGALVLYGIKGTFEEVFKKNPFKWD